MFFNQKLHCLIKNMLIYFNKMEEGGLWNNIIEKRNRTTPYSQNR